MEGVQSGEANLLYFEFGISQNRRIKRVMLRNDEYIKTSFITIVYI